MNITQEFFDVFVPEVLAIAGMSALVGTRMYDSKAPSRVTSPYMAYGLDSERIQKYVPGQGAKALVTISNLRIQVAIWDRQERSSSRVTQIRDLLRDHFGKTITLTVVGVGRYVVSMDTSTLVKDERYAGYKNDFKVVFKEEI